MGVRLVSANQLSDSQLSNKKGPEARTVLHMLLPTRTPPQPFSEYPHTFSDHALKTASRYWSQAMSDAGRVTHVGQVTFAG
jgi:hypothetical protein